MGIKKHERIIDGFKITTVNFDGRSGIRYQVKLIKILGPGLAKVVFSFIKTSGIKDVKLLNLLNTEFDLSVIGDGISNLLTTMDEDSTFELVMNLVSTTRVDGKELSNTAVFDNLFAGNYGLLYKILAFVLEVNFGNLFNMDGIGRQLKETESNSLIPSENDTTK